MRDIAGILEKTTDCLLLETVLRDSENRRSFLFAHPRQVITCPDHAALPFFFASLQKALDQGYYLAGFLAYEFGYLLEPKLHRLAQHTPFPLAWFGVYDQPLTTDSPIRWTGTGAHCFTTPRLAMTFDDYAHSINRIRDYIAAGDTYQINFTTKYSFDLFGDPLGLYASLRRRQRVPYAAVARFGNDWLLSCSPELFVRQQGATITTKPMKGTAPRSAPRSWLRGDEKNRSENLMIVDLLRNDLGKVCTAGSVTVPHLFSVERYETLWQMTSTVRGELRDDANIEAILRNIFPSGSITGAPKIRSMEIIRELEPAPRHIYTGAIGYISPAREAVFNVAIRTILVTHEAGTDPGVYRCEMGVGSGVTYDSNATEEYAETVLKGRFLIESRPAFSLIETMLAIDSLIPHLDFHLERLTASALFFGIGWEEQGVRSALAEKVRGLEGRSRVRLLLSQDGVPQIEAAYLETPAAPSGNPLLIAVSSKRTASRDIFLAHKTTSRSLYNAEFERCTAEGFADVLFMNEREEVTEGAISNVFIRKDGRYLTSPLRCGLLAGIGRRLFMREHAVEERPLFLADLKEADEIMITNAVRGARSVALRS